MIKEPVPNQNKNDRMIINEDHEKISFVTLLKNQFGSEDLDLNTIVRTEEFR